jgi:hypothetical protein
MSIIFNKETENRPLGSITGLQDGPEVLEHIKGVIKKSQCTAEM